MKKTIAILAALAGITHADVLLNQNFTTLKGFTQHWTDTKNNNDPSDDVVYTEADVVTIPGWSTGQWNGNYNAPHYKFDKNGATVGQPWKQN